MTVNINGEHFGSMREMIEKAQADPEWARQHGVHIGTVHKGETFVEKQVISGGKVHESNEAINDGMTTATQYKQQQKAEAEAAQE